VYFAVSDCSAKVFIILEQNGFIVLCSIVLSCAAVFVPPPHQYAVPEALCFYVACSCVCPCVRPSVRPSVTLFQRYLWFALMDFRQALVGSASWDKDELVRFWVQKVKS